MKRLIAVFATLLLCAGHALAANLGDYAPGATVYGKFTTYRPSSGATFTLGGTPALSVYKDNSTTQSTSGVTLTADFDSVTGLNHFTIDTSSDGTFYSAGSNFDVVITTGTVDSVSVTGSVVASFTLRKGTITGIPNASAGASGGLPTADSNNAVKIQAGTSTGQLDFTSGVVKANVTQIAAQTASASGTVTFPNATLASTSNITTVGAVSGAVGSVTGSVGSVTGNVGGNVTGSVGSVASGGISEASFATTTGSFAQLGITRQGTAQAASGSTSVTLDASAPFADNTNIGGTLWVRGSSNGNYWQPCLISAYVASTQVATVVCASGYVTPTGTITYKLFGTAPGAGGSLTAADVWTYGTRTVTAATNITSSGGTIPITASRVDASVGAYQTGLTPLQPTVAGRTLDVTTTGGAGIDWANVENPTTAVNLSGTTISTSQAVASVSGAVGSVTGNVGGTVNGLTSTAQGNVRTAVGLATANLDTQLAAIPGNTWDVTLASHLTSGSTGAALNAAGSAGDPWATVLPGAYGAGTAGNIIGNRLDAAVSSRLAPTVAARTLDVSATGEAGIDWANVGSPTTAVNLSGTTVGTVTTTTTATNLTNAPTNGDLTATMKASVATAVNGSTTGTNVTAIKAKTDNLTFTVGGQVDANTESMNGAEVLGNGTTGDKWRGQ